MPLPLPHQESCLQDRLNVPATWLGDNNIRWRCGVSYDVDVVAQMMEMWWLRLQYRDMAAQMMGMWWLRL